MISAMLALVLWLTPGVLVEGKCSVCMKFKLTSTVEPKGPMTCSADYCGKGMYNAKGEYIPPPACNSCSGELICSRGHKLVMTYATR